MALLHATKRLALERPGRPALAPRPGVRRAFVISCSAASESSSKAGDEQLKPVKQPVAPPAPIKSSISAPEPVKVPKIAATDSGSGSGGSNSGGKGGGDGGGGGGGGGGKGGDSNDGKKDEDPILNLKQVEAWALKQKVDLPADMLQTAQKFGLRASALTAYVKLQQMAVFGGLVRSMPWVRDRLIADDKFLFKVFAEVIIDTGCATVAEVRKRGDDFWQEFEFYLSDLLVGIVLDVALVSLMAPVAVIAGVSKAASATGIQKLLANVPSAVFEASIPGVKSFSVGSRFACLGVKFLEYSLAGIVCGFLGQGMANSLMLLKRQIHGESEHDVPVPPLVGTALVWGLFMGVSSNLRYQTVFGLERLVDLTIAKKVPQVAYATTVGIRFINNVIGGENFIDMARYFGVQ